MGFFDRLKQAFSTNSDGSKYLSGLDKSKKSFTERLRKLALNFRGINEEFLEELMIVLLEADLGIKTAQKVVDAVETQALQHKYTTFSEITECLVEEMAKLYDSKEFEIRYNANGPTVILLVGVNGSGKTTTTAKLANYFLNNSKTVAVAAADTFRAGAVSQLQMWADRLHIPCIKGKENADPSSVLVDACNYAKDNQIDVLIADTAGRLQNKVNLMKELEKMKGVLAKHIHGAPSEVWLVLDATTGQNGISQAELFLKSCDVSGIILTKMDGTAKGGIVIAIRDLLGLPVQFIGLGENVNDLRPFDISTYLYGLSESIQIYE